ncbi:head GIN domain-containing protein [Kordiimonas sp. SCSIO 12610]|uniref:head GIN domain-containing protein n=1 Tax=Kordiimonas sp. SCSIO 12610 TaxID=2829597 RepID=UPI002109EA48|nr:head GIN domain-containing protein [Kordiimonas sp. SCSIO 12610]UTW55726.1 DUF2807 domain-containing protein [Kordiimonas sp. SCSIO 12610]
MMDKDSFFKHGVFGVAIVALISAAAISGNSSDNGDDDNSYSVSIDLDDDYESANGDRVTETRDLAAFNQIQVKGGIELDLTAGGEQSVTVSTDSNRINLVETYVENDTLVIDLSERKRKRFWNNVDVDVKISVANFDGIEILGAVDGDLTNINSDRFEIDIRGAADLKLEGNCKTLVLDMRGAGDIDADKLECESVDVDLKGAGAASVYASQSVDALLAGVGSINVYGDPKDVNKRTGGIGTIQIK